MFEKEVAMTTLQPNEPTKPTQSRVVKRDRLHEESEKEFVLDKKKAGYSIRAIADMTEAGLGYPLSKSTVQARLEAAIADIKVPLVEEVRAMEIERLDNMLTKLEPKINEGDDKAIAVALRISERRSKLLGADAPVNVQAVVANVDVSDTPFGQMLQNQFLANQAAEQELLVEEDEDDA